MPDPEPIRLTSDQGKVIEGFTIHGTDFIRVGTAGEAECRAEMARRAAAGPERYSIQGGMLAMPGKSCYRPWCGVDGRPCLDCEAAATAAFRAHLDGASATVAQWPEWKRNLMGRVLTMGGE